MTACPFLSPFLQIEFTFVLKNQKFLNVNRRGHYRIFFRDSSSPFGAKSIKEVVSHFFLPSNKQERVLGLKEIKWQSEQCTKKSCALSKL